MKLKIFTLLALGLCVGSASAATTLFNLSFETRVNDNMTSVSMPGFATNAYTDYAVSTNVSGTGGVSVVSDKLLVHRGSGAAPDTTSTFHHAGGANTNSPTNLGNSNGDGYMNLTGLTGIGYGSYIELSLSAGAGQAFNSLTGVSIEAVRNGGLAPSDLVMQYSLNGTDFINVSATSVNGFGGSYSAGYSVKSFNIPSAIDLTSVESNTLTFRIYGTASGNGGNMHIKSLAFTGTTMPASVIPEPTTASLSLLGLTALMLRRRK